MTQPTKVRSVIELAKYRIGQALYRVSLEPLKPQSIEYQPEDEWMVNDHPKVFYERGMTGKAWKANHHLPRLGAVDFQYFIEILTGTLIVTTFTVTDIIRSANTGEFIYINDSGEQMPENCLLLTALQAERERNRIYDMVDKWVKASQK